MGKVITTINCDSKFKVKYQIFLVNDVGLLLLYTKVSIEHTLYVAIQAAVRVGL